MDKNIYTKEQLKKLIIECVNKGKYSEYNHYKQLLLNKQYKKRKYKKEKEVK